MAWGRIDSVSVWRGSQRLKKNCIASWFASMAFLHCLGLPIGYTGFTSRDGCRQSHPQRLVLTSTWFLKRWRAAHCFQAIVSADDVHRGKPDPEVYLLAASRVGAQPDRCIVVEDAVAGIEGAHSAGMRSIGVARHGEHLAADVVVESLERLDSDAFEMLLQGSSLLNWSPSQVWL